MFEDLKPHIADLRKRLVISSITVGVMFFVCFAFYEPILQWMMVPVEAALPIFTVFVMFFVCFTFYEPILQWMMVPGRKSVV